MYTRFEYLVKRMLRFMTNARCRNVCLRVRNARLQLAHPTMMAQHGAQFVRERASVLCCECAAINLFAVLRLGASVSVTHMLLPHGTNVKLRHFMPVGRSLSSHALHLLNMISIMPTPQQATAHHSVANVATHKPGTARVRNFLLPSTGLLADAQPHVPLVLVQK
jgi:hypothetical protein